MSCQMKVLRQTPTKRTFRSNEQFGATHAYHDAQPGSRADLREKPRRPLTYTSGVSVMETQLGYLKLAAFNPMHHTVLVRDPA